MLHTHTSYLLPTIYNLGNQQFIHSFHWHVQNATIPCHSQLLPFLSVIYFCCHPSPPTILPSFLTSSCHLFLGLPLNLVVYKFIYNILVGILFSSILCICPNQHNLFNLIVSFFLHTYHAPWYYRSFFIHQLMHKWTVLKAILKFTLKLTLKQLWHVSVQSHLHQGVYFSCFLRLQLFKWP